MDNQRKLFQVFATILKVDIAALDEDSSPDTIRAWDSLAVVVLVGELEQAFNVEFDIMEIADFRNIGIVKTILMEKGIVF